ncbi:MAG TPA: ATP-binding protein [Bryobacteraceae bacterium]|nr:ATP-binding protein [Bryobacteraceae bacterium]
MPGTASNRWASLIRPHDLLWVAVFAAALATTEYGDAFEIVPLAALGVAQILEPKIPTTQTKRSRVFWIVLKIVLSFVLIGFGGGINSRYWPALLLPVVSAATTFGFLGTMTFTVLTCGAYLIYLAFVTTAKPVTVDLELRVLCLVVTGNLANTLAQELREQSERQRRTAEQLAEANERLQEAEKAARRADRLAALGQLSAGLAHELRNPLGTIKASAELLQRNVSSENEVAREMAGFIGSEVDRTNSLVTRFLQFARPLQLRRDKADLTQTLDRAIAQVEREAKGAAIYKNYEPEIAPFPFDAELMERVFYNLILNAVQASPPGGAVSVKTRQGDDCVEISVIDRGSGIDPANRDSIFNPFFTTKPEGVGLGLAIVFKIVDEHGGKITVESEPGKGSIFHVVLPNTAAASSAPTGSA